MQFRFALQTLAVIALAASPAVAQPKVAPVAKLAPLCEAHITMVNQKDDPAALPVKVLTQARTKIGPYIPNNPSKKLGGVKVTTVLTGTVEYQDGTARGLAPFICMGNEKQVGFHYVSRRGTVVEDRPAVPVQDCYLKYVGAGDQASVCVKEAVVKSEADLDAALAAGKARLAPGSDEIKNFEASQTEFVAYRTRSCDVFKAPDASTDAGDFYNACVARVNLMRAEKLKTPPPPAPVASATPAQR